MPDVNDTLILPTQAGLKETYIAALKLTILEGKNDHWLSDIIDALSADCGVNSETTKDRIKQLVRFGLFRFLHSSIGGHRYRILVFKKRGEKIVPVERWREFNRLAEAYLKDITEPDLIKVHKMMKEGGKASRRKAMKEVTRVLDDYDKSVIVLPGRDTIESKVVFEEKMTTGQVCDEAQKQLDSSRAKDENSTSKERADFGWKEG